MRRYCVFLICVFFLSGCMNDKSQIKKVEKPCTDELYIKFNEETFHLKSGEYFDYRKPIEATNGTIDSNNAIANSYTKGKYEIKYTVYCEQDRNVYKEYIKELIVE